MASESIVIFSGCPFFTGRKGSVPVVIGRKAVVVQILGLGVIN
jgi:hypothetical protein